MTHTQTPRPVPSRQPLVFTDAERHELAARFGAGTVIGLDEFDGLYRPITGAEDSCALEYPEAVLYPTGHVWTLVDGDEGEGTYAVAGWHVVNQFGYAVTHVPWTTGAETAVWTDLEQTGDPAPGEEDD